MSAIASRYARAFADVVASSKLDAAKVVEEVEQLASVVLQNPAFRTVLENPAVPAPQKVKLLDALVAQSGYSKQTRNFFAVLMDQRRVGIIGEIAKQLKTELSERMGFAEAEIISSRELSADERKMLEAQLAKVTGKTIRAKYSKDAGILGGAVVKVGSTVYDGSVKGQLSKMKQQIAAG